MYRSYGMREIILFVLKQNITKSFKMINPSEEKNFLIKRRSVRWNVISPLSRSIFLNDERSKWISSSLNNWVKSSWKQELQITKQTSTVTYTFGAIVVFLSSTGQESRFIITWMVSALIMVSLNANTTMKVIFDTRCVAEYAQDNCVLKQSEFSWTWECIWAYVEISQFSWHFRYQIRRSDDIGSERHLEHSFFCTESSPRCRFLRRHHTQWREINPFT